MNGNSQITGAEIDELFDNGEDVLEYFDVDNAVLEHNPPLERRVTLKLPSWMIDDIDAEAKHLAISRNAVVNTWLADHLRQVKARERELQTA